MAYEDNPSFCVLPWVHRVVESDGQTRECCYSPEPHGDITDWEEEWNGDRLREMRRKMVAGEKVSACDHCYYQEANNKVSKRQGSNMHFLPKDGVRQRVARSIEQDYRVDEKPISLEIRFGSLCNLKCKMCEGRHSNSIRKDAAALKRLDPAGYDEFLKNEDNFIDTPEDWFENPEAMQKLQEILPHLVEINYSGGEPTMTPEYIRFLQYCSDQGYAENIDIHLTTNGTNINTALLEQLIKFKSVTLAISADGTGSHYEYIRVPAKWDRVEQNMIKTLEFIRGHNVTFRINIVVQLFNILNLSDDLDRFRRMYEQYGTPGRFRLTMTCVYAPELFRLDLAPDFVRHLALTRLARWSGSAEVSEFMEQVIDPGHLDMVMSVLCREGTDDTELVWPASKILRYAEFVDQNKPKSRLQDKIPELHRILLQAE